MIQWLRKWPCQREKLNRLQRELYLWKWLETQVLLPHFSCRSALTSYRALLIFMELAFNEAQHQAGLAHCRLAQKHQFELTDFVASCVQPVRSCSTTSSCHDLVTSLLLWTWVGTVQLWKKRRSRGESALHHHSGVTGSITYHDMFTGSLVIFIDMNFVSQCCFHHDALKCLCSCRI